MAKHIMTFLFTLIFTSLASIFPQTKAHTNCSNEVPHIPTKGHWSHHQNDTVFELRCKDNTTMIHFPSYGHDLAVKSISYEAKKLDLIDPENCLHGVFLNLNLSLTPFRYYYDVKSYTYINCSTKLSPSFLSIPCLSDREHYVYTIEASMDLPSTSCKAVKTIDIPFEYNPYLDDNSFGLGLTWDSLQSQNEGFKVGLVQVLAIGIAVFAAVSAFLTINKAIYHSKKQICEEESLRNQQFKAGIFLGDYRAFSSSNTNYEAYVDQVNNRC